MSKFLEDNASAPGSNYLILRFITSGILTDKEIADFFRSLDNCKNPSEYCYLDYIPDKTLVRFATFLIETANEKANTIKKVLLSSGKEQP